VKPEKPLTRPSVTTYESAPHELGCANPYVPIESLVVVNDTALPRSSVPVSVIGMPASVGSVCCR